MLPAAPQPTTVTLFLPTEQDTSRLGLWLADHLRPGDVVLLNGQIGAGKTHLCRALIRATLGHAEDIPSPTFTLVQTYETPEAEIWHADLYRLTHPDEVIELGLEAAFGTAICLIEWPEKLGPLTPPDALHLTLALKGEGRSASFQSRAHAGLLAQLARDWPANA